MLRGKILQLLRLEPQPLTLLTNRFPQVNKEKLWSVVDKLQSEQEITQDSNGTLRAVGPVSK